MKLIFDENLSPKLVALLAGEFPRCSHIETLGFKGDDDLNIWTYSKSVDNAVIVSKDDDFRELALKDGPPPKVIHLQTGNCSTNEIETLLRKSYDQILAFSKSKEAALLELFQGFCSRE